MLMNVRMRMRRAMLDTEEEDGYLIALWPLSSSKQRANASIVPVRCLLTSSAFLLLLPMPSYIRCPPACSQDQTSVVEIFGAVLERLPLRWHNHTWSSRQVHVTLGR